MIFEQIPNFPTPSLIDNLLVSINHDLSGTAYINELNVEAKVKINRDVEKGESVYQKDSVLLTSMQFLDVSALTRRLQNKLCYCWAWTP